jgi:hypothetical protein
MDNLIVSKGSAFVKADRIELDLFFKLITAISVRFGVVPEIMDGNLFRLQYQKRSDNNFTVQILDHDKKEHFFNNCNLVFDENIGHRLYSIYPINTELPKEALLKNNLAPLATLLSQLNLNTKEQLQFLKECSTIGYNLFRDDNSVHGTVILSSVSMRMGIEYGKNINKEAYETIKLNVEKGTVPSNSVDVWDQLQTPVGNYTWSKELIFDRASYDDRYITLHFKDTSNEPRIARKAYSETAVRVEKQLRTVPSGSTIKYRTSQNTADWSPDSWFSAVEVGSLLKPN